MYPIKLRIILVTINPIMLALYIHCIQLWGSRESCGLKHDVS